MRSLGYLSNRDSKVENCCYGFRDVVLPRKYGLDICSYLISRTKCASFSAPENLQRISEEEGRMRIEVGSYFGPPSVTQVGQCPLVAVPEPQVEDVNN